MPLMARLGHFEMSAQWSLLGVKQTFSESRRIAEIDPERDVGTMAL
jgi:hypothetical protein